MSSSDSEPDALEDVVTRLAAFRRADKDREELLEEVVRKYHSVLRKYREKSDELDSETMSRKHLFREFKAQREELEVFKQSAESNPVAFVIIDGDGAVFREDLIARGDAGGADAAHQLRTEVKKHLKNMHPDANVEDWNIIVQVVLYLDGLSKKLQQCGLVKSAVYDLPAFARAFGRTQPLFSVVDVGDGKEQADHKIREMLRVMIRLSQCKHFIFGPCHDNGYLPVLEPFKREAAIASKLTLLETTPPEPGFVQLGFNRISFPSVFRSEPLPASRPVALPTRPVPTTAPPAVQHVVNPPPELSSSPLSTWTTVGKGQPGPKIIDIAATTKKAAPKFYFINSNEERVDPELPRTLPLAEKRFQDATSVNGNFCNNYHLLGPSKCENGEYCGYVHGNRLPPQEQLVLRHKARSLFCPRSSWCPDPTCYMGHNCRYGKSCTNSSCRFAATHHVKSTPAFKVFEDGTRQTV